MFGAGRENHATKPHTEDEIVDELAHKEMDAHLYPKKGQATHILFGHGADQSAFEKRDFGTMNDMFFDQKMKTEKMINPHFYVTENKKLLKGYANYKQEDTATLGKVNDDIKAKDYSEATGSFDATWKKTGLRG